MAGAGEKPVLGLLGAIGAADVLQDQRRRQAGAVDAIHRRPGARRDVRHEVVLDHVPAVRARDRGQACVGRHRAQPGARAIAVDQDQHLALGLVGIGSPGARPRRVR